MNVSTDSAQWLGIEIVSTNFKVKTCDQWENVWMRIISENFRINIVEKSPYFHNFIGSLNYWVENYVWWEKLRPEGSIRKLKENL